MNFGKIFVPVAGLVLLGLAYRAYGWAGVALAGGAIVMFLLMHFNRTMQVLKRAADRPIGTVASAVMLNAKLKPKVTLLHVIAMTRALGEQRSPQDVQPEVFRWTDSGGSWVDATFAERQADRVDADAARGGDRRPSPADAPSADAVKPGAADALRPPV